MRVLEGKVAQGYFGGDTCLGVVLAGFVSQDPNGASGDLRGAPNKILTQIQNADGRCTGRFDSSTWLDAHARYDITRDVSVLGWGANAARQGFSPPRLGLAGRGSQRDQAIDLGRLLVDREHVVG